MKQFTTDNIEVRLIVKTDDNEVPVILTEEEIVIAVDALTAKANEATDRQTRAWTVEGMDINGPEVEVLGELADGYRNLAGRMIFASGHSWKSSDNRRTYKEVYELAQQRVAERAAQAAQREQADAIPAGVFDHVEVIGGAQIPVE